MRVALMIEGQNGLDWPHWQRILRAAEDLGYDGVWRSDHFTNASPPDKASLELWTSLTYAAGHTQRIEFGPLVAPVTFRHPSITARMAAAVDDLSGGRLVLGLGAGWQEREHYNFGIPFPSRNVRLGMLREYLEVVTRLLRSDEPVTFEGTYYQIHDAILLPRPQRSGGPPILIGGNGEKRTMPLAARYADEWNSLFISPQRFTELNRRMDGLLREAGREPQSLVRSLMVGTIFARDEADLARKMAGRDWTAGEAPGHGHVAGTPEMWIEQLRSFRDAGVERVMLQWLDLDDLPGIETVAREVIPAVRG
jgi:F420-dependent oxidoreductase-like protein